MRAWLVRAGRGGEQEQFAIDHGCAVVAWDRMVDLAVVESREEMVDELRIADPDASERRLANHAAQLWAFVRGIEVGDLVVLPRKRAGTVAVGRVTGPYRYRPGHPAGARHTRPVAWGRTDVPRSDIGQDLLWSLGASMTVCEVRRNRAAERLAALAGPVR